MKKTYSTPEIQIVFFAAPVVMQSQSQIQGGGDDSGNGTPTLKDGREDSYGKTSKKTNPVQ